jgi:hypothetical protein
VTGAIKPRMANEYITDWGYSEMARGWYDCTCQGAANDYCRYVSDFPNIYWSCALAGGTMSAQQYTISGALTESACSKTACSERACERYPTLRCVAFVCHRALRRVVFVCRCCLLHARGALGTAGRL